MTTDLKARLDAMVREATPGEWFIQEENDPGQLGIMSVEPSDDPRYAKAVHQITNAYVVPEGDARLICFLRNSVPDILAALSRLDAAEAQVKALTAEREWQPIETAPKNRKVLVGYTNGLGKWRTMLATFYTKGNLALADEADEWDQGDEEWAPEGWYEEQESFDYLKAVSETLTYWMPIPTRAALKLGGGETDALS